MTHKTPTAAEATVPSAAKTIDTRSIDAIVRAMYETISGPAGAPRDWARQRSLFLPGARMMAVTPRPAGEPSLEMMDAMDYEARRRDFFASTSFFESEIARRTDRFGSVAQVFSTYESRTSPDGQPFMRGINAIQLLWHDSRWWITSVAWQHEAPYAPIPAMYLTSGESQSKQT